MNATHLHSILLGLGLAPLVWALPTALGPASADPRCVGAYEQADPEVRPSRVSPDQIPEIDPRFDDVPLEMLVQWAQAWARNPELGGNSSDDLPVFQRLLVLKVGPVEFQNIVRDTLNTRLSQLEAKSKQGLKYDVRKDWDTFQAISYGLSYSTAHHTPEMNDFLIDTLQRVTRLEKSGWGYQDIFPYKLVEALKVNLDSIENQKPPPQVRDRIRASLRARAQDLAVVRDELQALSDQEFARTGTVRPYHREIATLNYLLKEAANESNAQK